ncbi:protein ENHANCED DISEASE RESISTANCE 2 isoform X2 [Nymphaea colorata]|uniref:protein ENHANCED DISEASE RESISTANCE 2 isoform X2 n=1 Tax=Nymphaea colorata TaxID=210225 RepID=UPI00214DFBE1|nr:protein ENHANCED DISEASE RESISTANCE 2 isoform X2 [Nymphaea colorata]
MIRSIPFGGGDEIAEREEEEKDRGARGIQMGSSDGEGKMEGWLHLVRSNRFGLQYSRKRYFVLQGNRLNCFKYAPLSKKEDPIRSAVIDSCIRVTDNGRENIHRKVLFMFTLYNSSDHRDRLKLGANSSEEAARWIHSFKEAALKEYPNQEGSLLVSSKRHQQYFRSSFSRGSGHKYLLGLDWTGCSSINAEPATTADVIAPSPWTIFGCQNGLRLFKEARDGDFHGKHYDDHPAIMAVGVVDATSESIFQTIMSLGVSRSEWDFCYSGGAVIEHLDGHTDIIHEQMKKDWLPRGMRPRDLLMRRYWRREDDGTYVILYHSVFHKKCLPRKDYVRATLKSGGYVISPLNQGRQSVVKHMLALDWRYWKSYLFKSCARSLTIKMTERVAALREMFRAKLGSYPHADCSSSDMMRAVSPLSQSEQVDKIELQSSTIQAVESEDSQAEESQEEAYIKPASLAGSFVQLNDAADEFFDVPEQSEFECFDFDADCFMTQCAENTWSSSAANGKQPQDLSYPKLSSAAVFVKKLHDLAVQRGAYIDLREVMEDEVSSFCYGSTLPKDPSCSTLCSWTTSDPSTFLIRGKHYLHDRQKIKAKSTLMQMVAADWLKSDRREDDLAGRPGSIVQKYAAQGGSEFFFIVNIQVPGSSTYSLALYYMLDSPLEKTPLLYNFVKGDDAYRNSRFKLIPYISKGSWIVKQSVGKKACLLGQALEINYFHGENYLELGVDIGSSTVARGVVGLVLGYLNNLVIEMAFLIQGNTPDELPEFLLGTCRLNHLDIAKSVYAGA